MFQHKLSAIASRPFENRVGCHLHLCKKARLISHADRKDNQSHKRRQQIRPFKAILEHLRPFANFQSEAIPYY